MLDISPGNMLDPQLLLYLPIWYVIFLFSLTVHEMAHSWIAMHLGDLTAYEGGTVTLDPRPHIMREKLGMVIFPLLTYFLYHGAWMIGWASAPYDPHWALRYPKRDFVMSMAGPATNLLLAFVGLLGLGILLATGVVEPTSGAAFAPVAGAASGLVSTGGIGVVTVAASVLKILLVLNVVLFLFNLLPIPPMDGSAIINLFLTAEQRLKWMMMSRSLGLMGLLLAWYIFPHLMGFAWRFVAFFLILAYKLAG